MPHRILLAAHASGLRAAMSAQLAADAHQPSAASSRQHTAALLAGQPFDLLVLGELDAPAVALELLRELRAGGLHGHARPTCPWSRSAPPAPDADVHAVRAYQAGSDQHLPADVGYLLLHAAIGALRRATSTPARRRDRDRPRVPPGSRRRPARRAHRLLTTLAAEPTRVLTKGN